jgi:putative peptide zinc metalloprotease protein
VFWLGHLSFVLGWVAAALLGWQVVLRPVLQEAARLRRAALGGMTTARRWRRIATCVSLALALVLLVPLPRHVLVSGVVWPADQAQLRAEEDGFVHRIVRVDGQWADRGATVLELSNPRLLADLAKQRARVDALEIELFNALPVDAAAAGNARAELVAAQGVLDRLAQRVAALHVRAQVSGRIVLPRSTDLPGRYVRRGELLGQVLDGDAGTVRVALPESEADALDGFRRGASIRLASAPFPARRGTLLRDAGGAGNALPSAALSMRHGGDIPTDPGDDLRPLRPVVMLDVQIDGQRGDGAERLGERAWVRFDAGLAPLAWQAAQALHRRMRQRFNPQY